MQCSEKWAWSGGRPVDVEGDECRYRSRNLIQLGYLRNVGECKIVSQPGDIRAAQAYYVRRVVGTDCPVGAELFQREEESGSLRTSEGWVRHTRAKHTVSLAVLPAPTLNLSSIACHPEQTEGVGKERVHGAEGLACTFADGSQPARRPSSVTPDHHPHHRCIETVPQLLCTFSVAASQRARRERRAMQRCFCPQLPALKGRSWVDKRRNVNQDVRSTACRNMRPAWVAAHAHKTGSVLQSS